MKYRKLLIAWSVAWGVIGVLLCVLWVRSYWWADLIPLTGNRAMMSVDATIETVMVNVGQPEKTPFIISSQQQELLAPPKFTFLGFGYEPMPVLPRIRIPYWSPVLLSVTFASMPWIRWSKRFSLRALLIATTLFAVGLGLIAWLSRAG